MKKALESHFQSAFHRGNGCYGHDIVRARLPCQYVWLSVRFSSRQWLLHFYSQRPCPARLYVAFSPLFIAAMVATHACGAGVSMILRSLSVRFSSRQWLLPLKPAPNSVEERYRLIFQSAFHRGNGCYLVMVNAEASQLNCLFQSAFHRGNGCYIAAISW